MIKELKQINARQEVIIFDLRMALTRAEKQIEAYKAKSKARADGSFEKAKLERLERGERILREAGKKNKRALWTGHKFE